MMDLATFRSHFVKTTQQGVFFDNASMGPVAPSVTQAMTECMQLREKMPMKYYQYAENLFPACRSKLAQWIGAEPEELAWTENVAYGINTVANALPLQAGDNVILCDREFASNVYPWMNLEYSRGVEVRRVPNHGGGLTVELLHKYADEHTKAVATSSVQFSDGFATDLEAIGAWCKTQGAFLVVDCAQSLGVLPMDVKRFGIDCMAGLSAKWLLGPFATGFLYVRKELIPQLHPPFVGADSVVGDVDGVGYDFILKPDAQRFESGLPNAPGIAGLYASLCLMDEVGRDVIAAQSREVGGYLRDGLLSMGVSVVDCAKTEKHRSSIISFSVPELTQVYTKLRQRNIACSVRCGLIRMGVHGYNTKAEVDVVISNLREIIQQG